MPNVDQFESVFKAADKRVYHYTQPVIGNVLVMTDLDHDNAAILTQRVHEFLRVLGDGPSWRPISESQCKTVAQLLATVGRFQPDLICTYRNLHTTSGDWRHTLGRHLDVLTQSVDCPVLVIPHPDDEETLDAALTRTDTVLAVTDHLAEEARLIDWAVRMTNPRGRLLLAHIEDDATFERYIETISKIPEIDTETARRRIKQQLLKEPTDYIQSCREEVKAKKIPIDVEAIVTMGRHLRSYQQIIEEQNVDLLVMNTKDEDQLAMHGLAYPLAIELRHLPLLML